MSEQRLCCPLHPSFFSQFSQSSRFSWALSQPSHSAYLLALHCFPCLKRPQSILSWKRHWWHFDSILCWQWWLKGQSLSVGLKTIRQLSDWVRHRTALSAGCFGLVLLAPLYAWGFVTEKVFAIPSREVAWVDPALSWGTTILSSCQVKRKTPVGFVIVLRYTHLWGLYEVAEVHEILAPPLRLGSLQ